MAVTAFAQRTTTPPPMNLGDKGACRARNLPGWILLGGLVLLIGLTLALMLGKMPAVGTGAWVRAGFSAAWTLAAGMLSALAAGMMLAVADVDQKLTSNPMASPEVLGSAPAPLGVVMMLFMVPGDAFVWLLPAGSLGAAATLLIVMIAAGRGGFSTERMLLAGIASAPPYYRHLPAVGQRRSAYGGLLTWLSGSTYSVEPAQALRIPRWWPPA